MHPKHINNHRSQRKKRSLQMKRKETRYPLNGFLCEWMPVAHTNIHLCRHILFRQSFSQGFSLKSNIIKKTEELNRGGAMKLNAEKHCTAHIQINHSKRNLSVENKWQSHTKNNLSKCFHS